MEILSNRKIFFEIEEEYTAVTKWIKIFEINVKSISNIIDNDQAMQAQLLFIKPNFENPETI